jgi:hypothetical protein
MRLAMCRHQAAQDMTANDLSSEEIMADNATDKKYGEGVASSVSAAATPKRASKAVNIAVICALFAAAVVVWAVMSGTFATALPEAEAAEVKTAVVHNDSGIVCELPLSTDTTFDVTSELGTNTIVVECGKVYVAEADCPGHDCMSQGRISDTSQTIVCLPHKLWIEITSDTQDTAFDAIGS